MNLQFDISLIKLYKNNSQKIRVMSEPWTEKNIFCPNCGWRLSGQKNNEKVSDFLCKNCLENFEQKASKNKFKGKTIAGEYNTYIEKLKGWILDIMNIVESLNKEKIILKEIYTFENDLRKIHPENKNIKAKIRQQLQFLRDKWYLEFLEKRGNYKVL